MVEIVKDSVVVGMALSGGVGSFILFFCLIHFLVASKKKKNMSRRIFLSASCSLFSSFIFCLGAALWRTDILFDINFESNNSFACHAGFGVQYGFYSLSKICLYLLFTFRIEKVFEDSAYRMNHRALVLCRLLFLIVSMVIIFGVIGFLPKIQVETKNDHILLCTGDTGFTTNFGDISIVGAVILDIVVTALLVCIFVGKLRHLAGTLLHFGDEMKISYNALITQLVKASVLASVAVFSTWIFLFVGMMLVPDIGWFVPIDATINGITIYLMFKFSETPYLFLCKPMALLCYLCFAGWDAAKEATKDERFLAVGSTTTDVSVGSMESDHKADFASNATRENAADLVQANISIQKSVSSQQDVDSI